MDQKEREILEHEADVRQGFLVERLENLSSTVLSLIEGVQAVSNPTEKMQKLSIEQRVRQREIALSFIAGGSLTTHAVQMCDDAVSEQTFLSLIKVFTEKAWEREN